MGDVTDKTFDTMHGRHPKDRLRLSSKVKVGKRAVTRMRFEQDPPADFEVALTTLRAIP